MNKSMMTVGGDDSFSSTLVSLMPFPIMEEKPGLIPGQFALEACTGRPSIKVIGQSIFYVFIDADRGSFRVVTPSYAVAKSVVNDYLSAQLAATPDAHPAFFWVPGALTVEEVESKYADLIQEKKRVQTNWFVELVRLGDDDWEKTHHHYSISDTQRYAARALDPENKRGRPWIIPNPL